MLRGWWNAVRLLPDASKLAPFRWRRGSWRKPLHQADLGSGPALRDHHWDHHWTVHELLTFSVPPAALLRGAGDARDDSSSRLPFPLDYSHPRLNVVLPVRFKGRVPYATLILEPLRVRETFE